MKILTLILFFSKIYLTHCQNTTLILSNVLITDINYFLRPDQTALTNLTFIHRLSSRIENLIDSVKNFSLSVVNINSIVFNSNTGDCSFPLAVASKFISSAVASSICFTDSSFYTSNFYRYTVSAEQMASTGALFMRQFSLVYFSIIISQSNEFYFKIAQKFALALTQQSFILEQFLFFTNISAMNLKSKVYFVICSFDDEISIYQNLPSFNDGRVLIFLRWSTHFLSIFSGQFPLAKQNFSTSVSTSVLHLIPVDLNENRSLTEFVNFYETTILSNNSNLNFSDQAIFVLHELENVKILRGIEMRRPTIDSNNQRLFKSLLVGLSCNRSWSTMKIYDPTRNATTNLDLTANICSNIIFPMSDATPENEAWRILRIVLFSLLGLLVLSAVVGIAFIVVRGQRVRKQMSKGPNKILLLPDDLVFVLPKGSIFTSKVNLRNEPHERSNVSIRSGEIQAGKTARFNGDLVEVKKLNIGPLSLRSKVMRELRQLKDLRHENLNPFLGIFIDPKAPALIYEYGQRGSLEDILKKEEIKLDWNFKWSMLNDLVRGMRYITNSPLHCHGNLKSRNCIVDSRWVLKITDYHLNEMYSLQNSSRQVELSDLLWTAPEHLRTALIKNEVATLMTSSAAGDVYSFGIIMQEVILRGAPFCMLDLSVQEIINKIRKPPPLLRPSVSKQVAPPEYINSMKQCWAEQPETRPSFNDLALSIKSLNGGKKVNIVDTMFKMLEQYSNNLEDLIKERTTQLEEEKKKTDKLLSQMLPPTVAESLKSGKAVEAVWYECVTIYFSDIVGFTTISALSSPMEVVDLLNDLYTMFDSILEDFDCYKVETIGDAYMVVSGLPIENGDRHASEIATMALTLLHACGQFRIRHMPGVPLRLRIGLHSGACVAGVVGLKMPRYCLFGDTVNTASRMESTSMAFRIHCSETTSALLEKIGGFHLDCRGVTEIKGRGSYKTFWLSGKDGFDKELPDAVISDDNHGLDKELVKLAEKKAREQEAQRLAKAEQEKNAKKNDLDIEDLLKITPPNSASKEKAIKTVTIKTDQSTDEQIQRKPSRSKW